MLNTEYDQLNVTGTINLNNAVLNLSFTPNADITDGSTVFNFINNDGSETVTGNFAGTTFGQALMNSGSAFVLKNNTTAINSVDGNPNDVGLLKVSNQIVFVSATWAGDATGKDVTDPILTNGQTATFGPGGNAFATIQDAINAYVNGTTTEILVNPGDYTGGTTINKQANIVLQGGAVIIESLDGSSNASEKISIPAGSSLTVGNYGVSNSFVGVLLSGAGSFFKAGTGTLTLTQVNALTGPIEVMAGTLQVGSSAAAAVATVGSSPITIDANATLVFSELGSAALPAPIPNSIGGAGNLKILGSASNGAVILSGSNSYSGVLTVSGGRFVAATAGAIGNPSSVSVLNNGQFSLGSLSNVTMSQPLTLASTGFIDSTIAGSPNTGALLLSGTNDVWSGPITVAGGAVRIDAVGTTGTISGAIGGGDGTTALQFGDGTTTDTFVLTGANTWSGTTTIQNKATVNIRPPTTPRAPCRRTPPPSTWPARPRSSTTISPAPRPGRSCSRAPASCESASAARSTSTAPSIRRPASARWSSATAPSASRALEILKVSGVTDVGDNLNSGITATSGTVTGIINVPTGTTLLSNTIDEGNTSATTAVAIGTVNQTGGTVTLAATGTLTDNAALRLGQTANGTGNYNLSSGTLSIVGATAILGIAEDGNGNFVQTGGTANAAEIDVNTRATGLGTGSFTLSGGLFKVGALGVNADGGSASASIGGGSTLQYTASGVIGTPLTLTGAATLDTQSFTVTDNSTISGSGPLTKNGTGTLSLKFADTYTGGTTATAGVISVSNNNALGTGSVTLINGATLSSSVASAPGLFEGSVAGFNNFTAPNPNTAITQEAREANLFVLPVTTTYIYTGQIFIPDSTAAFAVDIDDGSWVCSTAPCCSARASTLPFTPPCSTSAWAPAATAGTRSRSAFRTTPGPAAPTPPAASPTPTDSATPTPPWSAATGPTS